MECSPSLVVRAKQPDRPAKLGAAQGGPSGPLELEQALGSGCRTSYQSSAPTSQVDGPGPNGPPASVSWPPHQARGGSPRAPKHGG